MPRSRSSIAKKARADWDGIHQLNPRAYFQDLAQIQNFIQRELAEAQELEIEIGSGSGDFLLEVAVEHPRRLFLGIEYAKRFIKVARDRLEQSTLKNVLFLRTDARLFFERGLGDESVAAVHIYFPDPWPKPGQNKRRFLSTNGFKQVFRVLKPQGRLYFATDHSAYATAVLAQQPLDFGFRLVENHEFSPKNAKLVLEKPAYAAYGGRTHYGEKHLRKGKTIYAMVFEKTA